MFTSSKKIGPISTGHRQWKHDGHCSFVHGYGRYVEFTFACNERDEKGWVMHFGNLKDVKAWEAHRLKLKKNKLPTPTKHQKTSIGVAQMTIFYQKKECHLISILLQKSI